MLLLYRVKILVKSFWLQGKEKSEKEAYVSYLKELPELNILRKKLEEEVASIQRARLKSENFTEAAWPYSQASTNGEEKALTRVIEWLNY